VPEIYVLDGEPGINAFAAGWGPRDAAVAVTRGCLEQLDRDELQGVIAHEFSHVFHGDMRLNIRLMGVLFGIVCLTTIGRIIVRGVGRGAGRSSRGKGGAGAIVLFGVALMIIGALGVFFARLIQAALSRQREFLADASAVQYTRNPRGIGMALAKIGGLTAQLRSPHAEEASHMLFADGMKRFLGGALATHPPVEERVERVLPGFRRQMASAGSMAEAAARTPLPPGAAGFAGGPPAARRASMRADAVVGAVGVPQPRHVDAARELLDSLPLDLAIAVHDPQRAPSVVWALLLDRDPQRRERQHAPLRERDPKSTHDAATQSLSIAQAQPRKRMTLMSRAVATLPSLPAARRAQVPTEAR
jgi:hypothetical protein